MYLIILGSKSISHSSFYFLDNAINQVNDKEIATEKSLVLIRQNKQKPISRQRHPHFHFREIDRLMYPLKSPHPSPHHLSPIFSETFRSNLTSLNRQQYKNNAEHRSGYKDGPTSVNSTRIKTKHQEHSSLKSFDSTEVNQSNSYEINSKSIHLSNLLTNLLKTEK